MINRVLIRIKVVQMLYSYLLTRNEFKIEPAPADDANTDSRFAYRMYLDLMMFITELSGRRVGVHTPGILDDTASFRLLSSSPIARALADNEAVTEATAPFVADMRLFDDALAAVFAAVKSSDLAETYNKRSRELPEDIDLWSEIIRNIIRRSPEFTDAARSIPGFTLAGFERAFDMVAATFRSYTDNREALAAAFRNLKVSLDKAYDLYNSLLFLAVALTDLQARRLDAAKHKYMPSDDDLHPDTRFIDNAFVRALEVNPQLVEYAKNRPIGWEEDDTTLRLLLNAILDSDIYREYMASPVSSWKADCELWRDLYKKVIFPSDALAEALEAKSIFWNDDLDIMGTFVVKTVKSFAASTRDGSDISLLPKFKDGEDGEDARFGLTLFNDVVDHQDEYRALIDRFINPKQWDSERLAFMDIVIIMTAIAEILRFPAIPIPVSLNEYIEIANSYSTHRSGHFVNGVLFSVINFLKAEDKLDKPVNFN